MADNFSRAVFSKERMTKKSGEISSIALDHEVFTSDASIFRKTSVPTVNQKAGSFVIAEKEGRNG
jgi:hypothetical protein